MKLKGYGIFQTFKSGKLKKQLPVGVSYNYESGQPDPDLPDLAIVGISGSDIYYNKHVAVKHKEQLNDLWERDEFIVKKIDVVVEDK